MYDLKPNNQLNPTTVRLHLARHPQAHPLHTTVDLHDSASFVCSFEWLRAAVAVRGYSNGNTA